MKTIFWVVIAIVYFLLAAISYCVNNKIDRQYIKSKNAFKKDYGFRTYGVFELVQQYSGLSTIVNFIGFILAGFAALISMDIF
jgi:hypothetical protein